MESQPIAVFVWPMCGLHFAETKSRGLTKSKEQSDTCESQSHQFWQCNESPLLVIAHLVEMLMQRELPQVFSRELTDCQRFNNFLRLNSRVFCFAPQVYNAFVLAALPPSRLIMRWVQQCYWGVLPWKDISLHISLSLFSGIDYVVYFALSVFRHIGSSVIRFGAAHELLLRATTEDIVDYNGAQQLEFMDDLRKKYRVFCVATMVQYLRDSKSD